MSRAFGWKGYIPDIRAKKYAYSTLAKTVEVPNVKYGWSAPQLDQGNLGSCGPHAYVELFYTSMRQNELEPILLSPLDLYYSYRKHTNEIDFDSGVYNRLMLDIAATIGVCSFDDWPTDNDKWDTAPPAGLKRYKMKAYHEVDTSNLDEILNCLSEGYNFITGIPVYQSFEDAEDGIVPLPQKGDKFLGGHDILIQGFDRYLKIFYGQNHWKNWGFEGRAYVGSCHFTLPFGYKDYMADSWTITLTE